MQTKKEKKIQKHTPHSQPKNKIDWESVNALQCPVLNIKPSAACSKAVSNVRSLFRSSFVCHYKLCSPSSNGSSRLEISTIYPSLQYVLVLKANWLHHSSLLMSPVTEQEKDIREYKSCQLTWPSSVVWNDFSPTLLMRSVFLSPCSIKANKRPDKALMECGVCVRGWAFLDGECLKFAIKFFASFIASI